MSAIIRHEIIISILKEQGHARVIDFAEQFNVTEETIRRDFTKLEKKGKIIRKHGGAVLKETLGGELSFDQRRIQNIDEKTAIAKFALSYIKPGDTIFLDGSTTAWQMSRYMPDIEITVITDSIKVIASLMNHQKLNLISIGGQIWTPTQTMIGQGALDSVVNCHVNKCFFSCQGLDPEWGVSDNNSDIAAIKKAMLNHSTEHYLLVDSDKLQAKSLIKFADTSQIDFVFTDDKSAEKVIQQLRDRNIQVHVVENKTNTYSD